MRVHIADGLPARPDLAACFEQRGHEVVEDDDADLHLGALPSSVEVRQVLVATTADAVVTALDAVDRRHVVGAGLSPVLGSCLAGAALEGVDDEVAEVHVTYHVPLGRGDLDDDARQVVRDVLGATGRSWWGGVMRREDVAEGRRLAWFPRPVGPRHAVSVGLGDGVLVRRLRPVPTVSVSLSLRSALAEVVQLAGRGGRLGRRVATCLGRGVESVAPSRREAQRWAVVVEVVTPAGVTRAWANGTDVVSSHAEVAVAVCELALERAGATAAELGSQVLLDRLADREVLRWVVRRPT